MFDKSVHSTYFRKQSLEYDLDICAYFKKNFIVIKSDIFHDKESLTIGRDALPELIRMLREINEDSKDI